MCYIMRVKVRGQLVGVSSLLPPCRSQDPRSLTQPAMLRSNSLYSLSLRIDLLFYFLKSIF